MKIAKFNFFLKLMNTPTSRYFLRKLTNKKTKSGKNLLEEYLYCYFSGVVTDDMKSFMNYKTKMFGLGMDVVGKSLFGKKIRCQGMKDAQSMLIVLKTIGFYGLKKPFFLTNPLMVVWNITNKCNLRCIHCYQDAGNNGTELTLEEKFDAMDQLSEAGCIFLTFSGGEPLLTDDIFDILKYAKEKDMIIRILTNGTLITKDVANKISRIGVDIVSVSLDGAKKGTHDKIRGIPGSYERVIQGIKNCVKEEIPVHMSMTLTQYNYQEIDEVIELSKNLGINFGLVDFYPVGRGSKNVDFLIISPEMRYKIFKEIAEKSLQDKNIESLIFSPLFLPFMNELKPVAVDAFSNNVSIDFTQFRNLYFSGCCAGRMYFRIDSNGDIKPCGYIDIVVGNTKRDKIIDVWNNSEVFKTLRSRENLKGNCGSCKDKYICGGCRGRAWIHSKDLNAPDPGCIRNKVKES